MSKEIDKAVPASLPAWGDRAAVVVPKPEHQNEVAMYIAPGSGIVACQIPGAGDRLLVYFEGNINGASNLNTLEDRALRAYDRMSTRYPTIAMAALSADLFEVIGSVAPNDFVIDKENNALQAWIAHDPKLLESPVRHYRAPRR